MKPVLTAGQWERVLTTNDIPELEPDASSAFIFHKLGWFTWADALEHRRVARLMDSGITDLGVALTKHDTIKTDPRRFFAMRDQYESLKRHRAWHDDMADRIEAILPPMQLLERLKKEEEDGREGAEDGGVVGASDRAGAGRAPGGGEDGGSPRPESNGLGGGEGGPISIVR